jgi:ABC-type polysaccharide/polyol phosphate export permease
MDNKNLIKESKFAHYLIPLSLVLSNSIVFIFSLVILIAAVGFILKGLPALIIFLPLVVILQLILTAGISFITSLAYIKWRDTKYILDALLTVLFYLVPAFYSLDLVRESFSPFFFKIYVSNPLVGMLNLYRTVLFRGFYAVTRQETGIRELVVLPLCFSLLFLCLGLYLYRKYKDNINDYLSY